MNATFSKLNRLTRWELFQFLDEVLMYAESHVEEMSELYTNKVAELRTAFEALDDALLQEQKTSPEGLTEAEEMRDYAVRKIYNIIKEYSDYLFDSVKEKAASALLKDFKKHGTGYGIASMPQDAETAVITNLVQDLLKDGGGNITALDLTPALDMLKIKNKLFRESQHDRRKDEGLFVAGVVKTARDNAQNEFMAFAGVINALAIVEGPEKYSELKQHFNRLLDKYVAIAKQRTNNTEEETPEEVTQ